MHLELVHRCHFQCQYIKINTYLVNGTRFLAHENQNSFDMFFSHSHYSDFGVKCI